MNERDRLIDEILSQVAANRGVSSGKERRASDGLVNDIMAEREARQISPLAARQSTSVVPVPVSEEDASVSSLSDGEQEAKKKKRKEKKAKTEPDPLADITPWDHRHKEGRRGLTAEQAGKQSATTGRQGVENSQAFLEHLKKTAPTRKPQEEPAVEPTPSVVSEKTAVVPKVPAKATSVAAVKEQMDATYEPTRMVSPVAAAVKTTAEEHTIVVERSTSANKKEIDGQVRLDGFDKSEDSAKPQQWESDFVTDRQEKIDDFIHHQTYQPQNEEDLPLTHKDDGEYHSVSDAAPIKFDLLARRRSITLRWFLTTVLSVFALLFTLVDTVDFTNGLLPENPLLLMGLYGAVLLLGIGLNWRSFYGGLRGLFHGGDSDSPAALGLTLSVVQWGCMMVLNSHLSGEYAAMLVGAPALLGAGMNLLGKRQMFSRIYRNMELIGNDRKKYAVVSVSGKEEAAELGRGLSVGTPTVAMAKECVEVKDFLYHSYAPDMVDRAARLPTALSPLFGLAAVICTLLFVSYDSVPQAVVQGFSAFCGGICIGLPVASLLAGNVPITRFCRRLFGQKVMLSGYDAVETFADTDVLAVEASALFPAGSVTLRSIQSATNQSLDRSILDVAGVVYMADCPLKPLFQSILQGEKALLPQVDTLVYEEEMGISGWVTGYRVLVGTKKLMEHHGVVIPDTDFEAEYRNQGLRAVYLSTQGILSAIFLVQYTPDPTVAQTLQQVVAAGKSIHIYSNDANITREMVCRMFRLPSASVRVMGAQARRLYKQQEEITSEPEAVLSYEGDASGLMRGIYAATKLDRVLRLASVLQILFVVLGVVLFCACTYLFGGLSGGLVVFYQLAAALLNVGIPAMLGR